MLLSHKVAQLVTHKVVQLMWQIVSDKGVSLHGATTTCHMG